MIIPNGTIERVISKEGGLDTDGYPQPSQKVYGCPLRCQYEATSYDRLAKSNGEPHTRQGYWILIEMTEPICDFGRVRLKDWRGKEVGEFDVRQCIPYPAVCQMKILV